MNQPLPPINEFSNLRERLSGPIKGAIYLALCGIPREVLTDGEIQLLYEISLDPQIKTVFSTGTDN